MRYDKAQTQGRWPSILAALGVEQKTLSKNNTECPFCGGTDRFRFTDHEGAGIWICNQCGQGNGIQFVMRWEDCDFKAAVKKVHEILPQAHVAPVAAVVDQSAKLNKLWKGAHSVLWSDPVGRYLAGRGLSVPDTRNLRTHEECPYYEDGKLVGGYPAMLARVCDQHGAPKTLHVTYVLDGKKAPVKTPRKVLSKMGEGAVVHLMEPEDGHISIAEGIETALAVNKHFEVPVWSVLSAGGMQKFVLPQFIQSLCIWADNDDSFTGQQAAYNLAHRIARDSDARVAVMVPRKTGTDWADWAPKKVMRGSPTKGVQ